MLWSSVINETHTKRFVVATVGQENLSGGGVFVKEKCRHQESSTVIIFGHSCRISSDQDIFEVLGHRVTMIKFIINEARNTITILSLYFFYHLYYKNLWLWLWLWLWFSIFIRENFLRTSFFSFIFYFYLSRV